jgi:hypothetical protein
MTNWAFYRFGLLVTGKGEREGLQSLLRQLNDDGHSMFKVVAKIEQLSPRSTQALVPLKITGKQQNLPRRDEEIALRVRAELQGNLDFVILVDDLEQSRREQVEAVIDRYSAAGKLLLKVDEKHRFSVHLLINMMEAYFFADPQAVEQVLGVKVVSPDTDVEDIGHPKSVLKEQSGGVYDERDHAPQLLGALNLETVLGCPTTCRSLRTLVSWCVRAKKQLPSDRFCLAGGELYKPTSWQIEELPPVHPEAAES